MKKVIAVTLLMIGASMVSLPASAHKRVVYMNGGCGTCCSYRPCCTRVCYKPCCVRTCCNPCNTCGGSSLFFWNW